MPSHHIVFAVVFGLLFGAALAAAVYAPGSRKVFERDKAKFAAGQKRDPEKRPAGPHRSYLANFLFFAAIFLPLTLVLFRWYPPPI